MTVLINIAERKLCRRFESYSDSFIWLSVQRPTL